MNKEQFRLQALIARMELHLFISALHVKDWVKDCPSARYDLEYRHEKLKHVLFKTGERNEEQSCAELDTILCSLVSLTNTFNRELDEISLKFPKLANAVTVEKALLVTRVELENSRISDLKSLGEAYGKPSLKRERICGLVEWGAAQRAVTLFAGAFK